jgi:hypothetical protein
MAGYPRDLAAHPPRSMERALSDLRDRLATMAPNSPDRAAMVRLIEGMQDAIAARKAP